MLKRPIEKLLPIIDVLVIPLVYPAGRLLKWIRRAGVHRLPRCRDALLNIGVFPIRAHYYEPQFDYRNPSVGFFKDRNLHGIDLNVTEQLDLLKGFTFAGEFAEVLQLKHDYPSYHIDNRAFGWGDAEYWYQLIRAVQPRRIIEIGSGYSTLVAVQAIAKNRTEGRNYACEHICIEPYEMPWLEDVGVTVFRQKVEDVDLSFFARLEQDDILFIDSSHIIRPQGDVLFEYLQVLPSLQKGVIVHLHDIFTPKDYPKRWMQDKVRFWNEQYLLEAFLTHNDQWKVIGALNHLHHKYFDKLSTVAPSLTPDREPGSFYIRRIAEG